MAAIAVQPLRLEGLRLVSTPIFRDARGYFTETYNDASFAAGGIKAVFVQDNHSYSEHAGTIRGLHFQRDPAGQAKLVRVIAGRIWDVAVDIRPDSPTFGEWEGAEISAHDGRQVYVPEGFAHGFLTLEPKTEVAYKVTHVYAPAAESGILWNDPTLAIPWPLHGDEPILSEKDARLPLLADALRGFA